ncbi:hypothetical protein LX99_01032 [Mucilaginibacter oryzae]|uniref:Uncharacterized protein n=1 Tax=Mucilaginibacter oryzae TaxID=468058 RepID=A0A316HK81_9SPHI|nr:hypothetical protein LX99_01032 [Mucilaginibacter oryzae]
MIIRVFFVPNLLYDIYNTVDCSIVAVTVSRKASGESGQNNGGPECKKGHGYFLQKRGPPSERSGAKFSSPYKPHPTLPGREGFKVSPSGEI